MSSEVKLDANLESWLVAHGWFPESSGQVGSLWRKDDNRRRNAVGVPHDLENDALAFRGVVDRLAHQEGIDAAHLTRTLLNWTTDITYVRAANDFVVSNTIPLQAGATILDATRVMFRAAATAALRVRPSINGSYSRLGNELADSVRMGQTLEGSYIIPILVPVGKRQPAKKDDDKQGSVFDGPETEQVDEVESAERRMSRTFAEAMSAVSDLIVQPARIPKGDEIFELINRGVTREFVHSIVRVLDEQAVASIDTSFEWAPAQGEPAGVRSRIEVPSDAVIPLSDTARRLGTTKMPRRETFTGPVVMVAQEPHEKVVHFAIRTVRNSRDCRIESVYRGPLNEVQDWMRGRTTIMLQGNVVRVNGVLRIDKPETVSPSHLF